jgi:hypothetical protein
MRYRFGGLVWWPMLSLSLLVLLALVALIVLSRRGVARIEPARGHFVQKVSTLTPTQVHG